MAGTHSLPEIHGSSDRTPAFHIKRIEVIIHGSNVNHARYKPWERIALPLRKIIMSYSF